MKFTSIAVAAGLSSLLATPAPAQVAGDWRVAGKVSAFAFTLNCRFDSVGTSLGGVCTDASTNDPKVNTGKAHPLTSGTINGDRISWTYSSSFLFSRFDVTYSGVLTGDRMSGTVSAQGHDGTFTATRR